MLVLVNFMRVSGLYGGSFSRLWGKFLPLMGEVSPAYGGSFSRYGGSFSRYGGNISRLWGKFFPLPDRCFKGELQVEISPLKCYDMFKRILIIGTVQRKTRGESESF